MNQIFKLLRIEWNKLLPSRSFRVLIGIYTAVFSLFLLVVNFFFDEIDDLKELFQLDYNPMTFPDIWIITYWLAQPFTILAAIIVIALVVNEFNYRTARQHVIDGLTRFEFILAKFSMVKFIALICTVIIFLIATFVGLLNKQALSPTSFGDSFIYMAAFFFRTLGLLSFAMFLAVWIKRTGVAILVFIVLHTGLIALFLKYRIDDSVGQNMPIGAMNRLIRVMRLDTDSVDNFRDLRLTEIILTGNLQEFILVILYTALFFGLSYMIIMKKDLK